MADNPENHTQDTKQENRSGRRMRTLRRGRIVTNRRSSSFDVTVRDLSGTGAKLKLLEVWAVPTEFELQVLTPSGDVELAAHCRKMWQTGVLVGAKFVRPPRP